jgi:hypothetical protein
MPRLAPLGQMARRHLFPDWYLKNRCCMLKVEEVPE